ncbi:hypothetical protein [Embleya sp. NBC_00896]|uniref:hypothetical protein n=1 Tax=Embleya sp. NBC_00896 TaxID=2975961 RepID=UPI002F9078BB|nr:hypothetical protein OG928_40885 [Embleya sp. NBC_00896]
MGDAEIACGCADFGQIPGAIAQWWMNALAWIGIAAVVLLAAGIVSIWAGGPVLGLLDRLRGVEDEPLDDEIDDPEALLSFFTWHDPEPDPDPDSRP